MWWCQLTDLLKFETRPSSLLNFGKANTIAMCFAGVLLCYMQLACLLSLPPTLLGKYQFHMLVFPFQCSVDRCLEVGCCLVAMVTSLLLRRLGNSRKYPYPTTDGFHVLTPPPHLDFRNSKMHHPHALKIP